jgi:coproporphyrinogen III oxidase-like Fe-S oxidoreductase
MMSHDHFFTIIGFLKNAKVNELRLMGGEPSLHPEFLYFVRHGLSEGFNINVFSNGLIKEEILSEIVQLPDDRIKFCINSIDPSDNSDDFSVQEKTLAVLGKKAGIGINIYSPGQDIGYLIPMIEKHNLFPDIRIGLALPVVPPNNQYLLPKFYHAVGDRLVQLLYDASRKNINITFDCGFVPCMFPEEIKDMIKELCKDIGKRCNPLLDILPDGNVISCFPLYNATDKLKLSDYSDTIEIGKIFLKKLIPFKSTGIFPHCMKCDLFVVKECYGGCRAHVINRFKRLEPVNINPGSGHHDVKIISSSESETDARVKQKMQKQTEKWAIPYIDQPLEFWEKIQADYGEKINCVYFPLPGSLIGSGRPAQPVQHLTSFLERSRINKSLMINPVVLPDKVENIGTKILKETERIIHAYGIREITLSSASLALLFRREFPEITLTASTLMDIHTPAQLNMLEGLFDNIVPSGRILRDVEALNELRTSFKGKIRLLVNEACIPGCIYRTQHFYEMGLTGISHPESLCQGMLSQKPWLCLTGAWILPQFLDLYEGLFDELKLAGRITLQNKQKYLFVLSSYLGRKSLMPHEIGGGPASPLDHIHISKDFFKHTLLCNHNCKDCMDCMDYWNKNNSHHPEEKSNTIKRKLNEQTENLDRYIQQVEKDIPPEIDSEKIREEWKKMLPHYPTFEKAMPSPEWKEKELEDKGSRCWKILTEKINMLCSNPISVYIHVPFCDRKCNFCDCFSTSVSKSNIERFEVFSELLLSEIKLWTDHSNLPERQVTTIHFGGGTPNYLPFNNLQSIVNCLKEGLKVTNVTEFALESTSSLLSKEHLQELNEIGFTRLHIGIQTLDDAIRKKLGRKETTVDVLKKLEIALQMGFIVSADIIYGLPFQRVDSLINTLAQLIETGIHGFSLYHLNITDKNRRFFENLKGFERDLMHDYLMFQIADQYLSRKGYKKNHFVHYAREEDKNLYYNHVCRGEDLLALGPTADGFFYDYYYVHNWMKEYLSKNKLVYPPVHGGGHLSEHEFRLRPLKAQLLGANIKESLVRAYDIRNLIDKWQEYNLIQKLDGEYRLTGNGSWFINKMVKELMDYEI